MCGISAPQAGIKSTLPALEGKVLTTGVPGKSPLLSILITKNNNCVYLNKVPEGLRELTYVEYQEKRLGFYSFLFQ